MRMSQALIVWLGFAWKICGALEAFHEENEKKIRQEGLVRVLAFLLLKKLHKTKWSIFGKHWYVTSYTALAGQFVHRTSSSRHSFWRMEQESRALVYKDSNQGSWSYSYRAPSQRKILHPTRHQLSASTIAILEAEGSIVSRTVTHFQCYSPPSNSLYSLGYST